MGVDDRHGPQPRSRPEPPVGDHVLEHLEFINNFNVDTIMSDSVIELV